MSACARCGAALPSGARFCSACGAQVSAEAPHELRKTVSVLFVDLVGSTEIGERLDPEALRAVQTRYFEAARATLERHGGTVEKFIGDAVMAVFGAPVAREDDGLRAARAACEVHARLAALNGELEPLFGIHLVARAGVATGAVMAGDAPEGSPRVTGDTVNVAARLEQAAGPGETLVDGTTYALIRDAVDATPMTALELKGKSSPVAAFRLLGVEERAPGLARRLDAPLVGRSRELAAVLDAFERAREERAAHLVTVLGVPGIGKTRLAREVEAALAGRARVLVGRCLSYGEGITFWPLAEIVRAAVGEDARAGLHTLLADADDGTLVADRVAGAVGVAGGEAGEETTWAVRRLVETLASEVPLMLVVDDIHWAEPTFLDLLDHLADWTSDAPVLLLCLARPELLELRPGWGGGKLNATSLLLQPLSDDHARALLADLDAPLLDDDARARITEAAQGNPLFLEQLVASAAESGEVAIPPALGAVLAARLDRLEPAERTVLERGAVEGELFHLAGVEALTPELDRAEIEHRLPVLVRKELIRPERAGEPAYRFRHVLIREAAYEALPKELRSTLHERCADWLASSPAGRAAELEELIGYHLERAYRLRREVGGEDAAAVELAARAAERLGAAGRRALRRADISGGENLQGRAIELLSATAPERWELLSELGFALFDAGDLPRAKSVLVEAIDAAQAAGDHRAELHARCVLLHWQMYADPQNADPEALMAEATAAIEFFERVGDDLGQARAWKLVSELRWHLDGVEQATAAIERFTESARRAGNFYEETWGLANLGYALVDGPTPVEVGFERLQALRERARGGVGDVMLVGVEGSLAAMAGRFDHARARIVEAKAMA
jgi:class 3 adenylate cyclase